MIDDEVATAILALVDMVPVDDLEYVYPVESRVRVTLLSSTSVETDLNVDDAIARLAYTMPVDKIVRLVVLGT